MDHITQLLHQSMALIIFCIAITLLLLGYHNYSNLLEVAGKDMEEKILFEQSNDKKSELLTKGEIIASLCDGLEYDIEIDGFLISHYTHDNDSIKTYPIYSKEYRKSYGYDYNGNITRIIYKSNLDE